MNLFLEPVDVWLFRDGRPFNAGADHRAETVYPPFATVIQGALRSHHLVVKKVDLRDKEAVRATVGTAERYPEGFRVRGPYVACRFDGRVTLFFPKPADGVVREGRLQALVPKPPPDGAWSSIPPEVSHWFIPDGEPGKEEAGLWLSLESLVRYLETGSCPCDRGTGDGAGVLLDDQLYSRESRLGISISHHTRTVEEHALYEAEFVRPADGSGLYVEVDGLEGWPPRGLLRLGGESRAAIFEQVEPVRWPGVPDPLPERFKIYFATPAWFEGGWLPRTWSAFFEGEVRLVAAALSRFVTIGGFDVAAGHEKPVRRYVPAGSVYYFRSHGPVRLKADLINRAITEDGAVIGFGQFLVGRW